ncbi:MAG: alpha/beta fold hydrolase [Candidatus Binataceae bacterium]
MPFFNSAGVRIHYQERGDGAPVILVHGFGLHAKSHWEDTGLVDFLAARYRVIAPDARGHGHSDKPHTAEHYGMRNMCGDIIRLLDHLAIQRTLAVGYSMGSRVCLSLIMEHPQRFRAVVLGGFGSTGAISLPGQRAKISAALLAHDPATIADEVPRRFRNSLEASANDLKALAACISAEEETPDLTGAPPITLPVLLLTGGRDRIAGDPRPLVGSFGNARVELLDGIGHVRAPSERAFHAAIANFFAHAPD